MAAKTINRAMMRKKDGRIMPYSETLIAKHPGAYVEWSKETGAADRPLVAAKNETPLLKVPDPGLAPAPSAAGVVLPSDIDPDNPADPAAEAEMAARLAGAKAAARGKRK
ncbi:MAG: hypothetical protein IJT88_09620 [Kiritimatiellae bacterium]|nr:hypothetical protein [Kiritimatiellia bacterium]